MFAAEVTQDGIVNAADRLAIKNNTGSGGYVLWDVSLNGIVNAEDRLMAKTNTGSFSQVP